MHRVNRAGQCAALAAHLADPIVSPRRLDHAASFGNRVTDGLFDEHVLAGLHGPNRGQGVPVIGRRRAHDIDRRIVEHLANVLDEFWLSALDLGDFLATFLPDRLVGIDDIEQLHVFSPGRRIESVGRSSGDSTSSSLLRREKEVPHMILAAPMNTGNRHAEFLVGAFAPAFVGRQESVAGQGRHGRRGQQRILQKLPTREPGHRNPPS